MVEFGTKSPQRVAVVPEPVGGSRETYYEVRSASMKLPAESRVPDPIDAAVLAAKM